MRFAPMSAMVASAALAALVSPASASEWFRLAGAGRADLDVGAITTTTAVTGQPISIAAAADGSYAFGSEGRVFRVRDGRIAQRFGGFIDDPTDLLLASDGTLMVSDESVVWRLDAQGHRMRIAGQPGKHGSSGDGGPATAATLNCPNALDVDPAGGILIADPCARRIRRVALDGRIATVAGNGTRGGSGDGGPAVAASLRSPDDVVALADGGFAIADGSPGIEPADRIRVVDAGGTITTRAHVDSTELAAEPDGAILFVDWTRAHGAIVRRLRPDGTLETVVSRRDRAYVRFYGSCLEDCDMQIDSVARTTDGSLLIGGGYGVLYVPSASPTVLALGLARQTRIPRPTLVATIRITQAAHVTARVRRGGHLIAERHVDMAAGTSEIPFAGLKGPADYRVELRAAAGAQVATAGGEALVGGIPIRFARRLIADTGLYARRNVTCRRRGTWRVACGIVRQRRCVAVARLRVLADGSLKRTVRRRRCLRGG